MNNSTGGRELVRGLIAHGSDLVFCVPGESYLAALDALYDERRALRLISCRQEAGAANMAVAHGKLTGRAGICFVTRGPGATQAAIGVHTAFQDSVPMILFIGQVARADRGREAFQEVDFEAMFAPLCKWAVEVNDPDQMRSIIDKAFHLAHQGRPGPVVVSLPEDVLSAVTAPQEGAATGVPASPAADFGNATELLSESVKPIAIVGGYGWTAESGATVAGFCERNNIPLVAAFRSQDVVDNRRACYAGDLGFALNPALGQRVRAADLVLAIGTRLGDITTGGYTHIVPPSPSQKLIHIHRSADELGKVFKADIAVNAPMEVAVSALAQMSIGGAEQRQDWYRGARIDYETWQRPEQMPGPVQLGEIIDYLNDRLGEAAILCNGAGNYTGWLHRHYRYKGPHTQLAPKSGAMGFGVPAAIAAKLARPDADVIAFAGDGCFLMTGQELATAKAEGANIVVIVINNGMYGTIRLHQEKRYPGRVIGTDLINPDFAAFARAFGCHGARVERTGEFAPAFEAALAADRPSLIEIIIDPDAISSQTTLTKMGQQTN